MNKRIILPFSKQTKLRDMFGTSHNTVRRALKFETRSKFADRIRAAAINASIVIAGTAAIEICSQFVKE